MKGNFKRAKILPFLITGSLVLGGTTAAFAADANTDTSTGTNSSVNSDANVQNYNLKDVVVTATRTEKKIIDTPANTQVITAKQIKNGGYSSVFEAIQALAQANVLAYQEDGGDYGSMLSRIKLRGVDSGTLLLVNGNPANYMNMADLNSVPIDQVEKIEIVKGANSVLYGPQAIGGVVNIITKKPVKTGKVTGNISGTIGSRIHGTGLNVQTDDFDLGIKKSFSKDFNNVEFAGSTGKGPSLNIKNKSTEQLYFDANLAKDLTFNYSHTDNKASFEAGKFINYDPAAQYMGNYDSIFNNYSLVYDSKETGVKAVAGYNTFNATAIYDKSYPKYYSNNKYWGYNANFDIQKKFRLRDDKDSFILGTNFTRENMQCNYPPYASDAQNGRNSYSLYQSYDYKATDKFNLIFGLREYYMTKSQFQNSDFELLPQFQGLYKVNSTSSYYFNIGKSFEMPDITSGFFYGGLIATNSDLKPQSGWSYEVGHKFDDGRRTLTTDLFYMNIKDKFYWAKTSTGLDIMENHNKWQNVGLEINYNQKLNKEWSANAGLTVQNAKAYSDDTSRWTQDSSKYIFNVGATYNKSKFMADARIFTYLDRENSYYDATHTVGNAYTDQLPNSCDLTVTLGYKPTKTDSFKLIGRNLLNRKDIVNVYDYYAMPANVTFVYEKSF